MYNSLPEAIKAVNSGNAVLIDVRTKAEHEEQSAHNALHIDVEDIQSGSDPNLEKDTPILVHCRSGGRAGVACTILTARGYTRVQNIGGLDSWSSAGGQTK